MVASPSSPNARLLLAFTRVDAREDVQKVTEVVLRLGGTYVLGALRGPLRLAASRTRASFTS